MDNAYNVFEHPGESEKNPRIMTTHRVKLYAYTEIAACIRAKQDVLCFIHIVIVNLAI